MPEFSSIYVYIYVINADEEESAKNKDEPITDGGKASIKLHRVQCNDRVQHDIPSTTADGSDVMPQDSRVIHNGRRSSANGVPQAAECPPADYPSERPGARRVNVRERINDIR